MINEMTSREAITDLLYRFAQSLDDQDPVLLANTMTTDTILDLTAFSEILSSPSENLLIRGRPNVTDTALHLLSGIATTHQFSNVRVEFKGEGGDEAVVRCYVRILFLFYRQKRVVECC